MKKRIFLCLFLMIFYESFAEAKHFIDVPYDYWDYQSIDRMSDEGIINGIQNEKFMPKRYITRAEYATGIIKAINKENIPVQNAYAFDDINNNHWAWNYVIRAIELDIIKPVSENNFYPDGFVTRNDILTFLVNILKSENITKKEALDALRNEYLDYDDIPDWFKVTAGKAEILGVVAKEPPREKYLDEDKYITRAQFAYFMDKLNKITQEYIEENHIKEISPKKLEQGGIIVYNTQRNEDIVTVDAQTILPIVVSGQIKSGTTKAGTMFNAKFADDIIDEERNLLLPKDIILTGKVIHSETLVPLIKGGGIKFEISAVNQGGNLTRIMAIGDVQTNKHGIKIKNSVVKDGQITYIKLYKPIRINIVTGTILD